MDGRDASRPTPPPEPQGVSRRGLLRLGLTARADVDYDGVTERVRAGWETGASEELLRALEPVAGVAVALALVTAGERVLDAGAGDGNVALECVWRAAEVEACDIAGAMVERGRARCGPGVRWTQADVQALPYPDGAFDAVISTFGATLAPRGRRVARELVRVLRPGGRLVLAAWSPRGLPGALHDRVPLPDGILSPTAWADEETARRRFGSALERFERRAQTVPLGFGTPEAMFDAFTRPLGLDEEARAALRPAFDGLLAAQSSRAPAAEIDAPYVLYTGRRPG